MQHFGFMLVAVSQRHIQTFPDILNPSNYVGVMRNVTVYYSLYQRVSIETHSELNGPGLIPRGSKIFLFVKSNPYQPWGSLTHQRVQGVFSGVKPPKSCTNFPPPSSIEFRTEYNYGSNPSPPVSHGKLRAEIYVLHFKIM